MHTFFVGSNRTALVAQIPVFLQSERGKKFLGRVVIGSSWALLMLALFWLASALFDLSEGRFQLFMDEQISFDGTYAIYNSASTLDFLRNVAFGFDGDLRYGRAFWNTLAVVSYPAYLVFGIPGLIVSNRLAGLFFLAAAYVILGKSLGLRGPIVPLSTTFLILLPTTLYFASMPKPEPLVLLALSCAVYFFQRQDFTMSRKVALLLGFAFGTKVSALVLVGLVVIVSIAQQVTTGKPLRTVLANLNSSFFWGLFGWVICSPIMLFGLWPVMLASFAGAFLMAGGLVPSPENRRVLEVKKSHALIGGLFSLASVVLGFRIVGSDLQDPMAIVSRWWRWVSGEARIGATSEDSVWRWAAAVVREFYGGFTLLLVFQLAITLIFAVLVFRRRQILPGNDSRPASSAYSFGLGGVFVAASVLDIALIVSGVERTWPHYLHLAFVLSWVAFFGVMQQLMSVRLPSQLGVVQSKIAQAGIFSSVIVGWLVIALVASVNADRAVDWRSATATRTTGEGYKAKLLEYNALLGFLDEVASENSQPLKVAMDPGPFQPNSEERWTIERYWAGRIPWAEGPDLITAESDALSRPGNAEHVASTPGSVSCEIEPCYVVRLELPSGIAVLTRLGN